jgi:ubiquitin
LQQIEHQAAKLRLEYNNSNAIEKEKAKLESLLK